MMDTVIVDENDYGPRRLVVELTNICNLHCSYCLRDEDALYHTRANFFPIDLLRRILKESRETHGVTHLMITGGEPTLHPQFDQVLDAAAEVDIKTSFITNGWHFDRVWPTLRAHGKTVTHVAFSLDGATRETHDHWRGEGSFLRLVRAFSKCKMGGVPFAIKVAIRKDTLPHLEQITLFAARLGAAALFFGHVMPTSLAIEDESALSFDERTRAEQEIASLSRIFKMRVGISVGYYFTDAAAPCSALAGVSFNIDYKGRLSLCCNLSGYRGASGEADVVADLTEEDFATACGRLNELIGLQMERRRKALEAFTLAGKKPDLETGAPCLFCLKSLSKVPWTERNPGPSIRRSLPLAAISQST
jgi:MoaA/NifB/PqqE/SkfB family radical SAM enzyme